ncbi:integrase core domain-containing protein [Flavitalea antarctica]
MRRELLNAYLFHIVSEVKWLTEEWRLDNNTERTHKSLGSLSPIIYADLWTKADSKHRSLFTNGEQKFCSN